MFPQDARMENLANRHAFEQAHPATFSNSYLFLDAPALAAPWRAPATPICRCTRAMRRAISSSAGIPRRWCTRAAFPRKSTTPAVQDDYQLYHHVFAFTATGQWCIVQQG